MKDLFICDTTVFEFFPLSLHDALPIFRSGQRLRSTATLLRAKRPAGSMPPQRSTGRLARSRRSEEHTPELQSPDHLACRLLLETKKCNTSAISASARPAPLARPSPITT